jgi:Ca2+-binding RTX toxin-like protein
VALSCIHEIHIWGRAGNDKITVLLLDIPALLHGGDGNDEIIGGMGSNLVFGDGGNDKLTAGVRSDLLVGGDGSDSLFDAPGNDVLLGGRLSYQLTGDFLRQMLQQWSASATQNTRFKQSVTDDNAVDTLFDTFGDDWYLLNHGDFRTDLVTMDHDVVTNV